MNQKLRCGHIREIDHIPAAGTDIHMGPAGPCRSTDLDLTLFNLAPEIFLIGRRQIEQVTSADAIRSFLIPAFLRT